MSSTGNSKYAKSFGPLSLQLEFKKDRDSKTIDPINVDPQNIKELTITLDINRFLPEFHLTMDDSAGLFTHIIPFDHNLSKFHIQLGRVTKGTIEDTTLFSFDVYRRSPNSDLRYDANGLLQAKDLFSPGHNRALTGNVKESIEAIGTAMGAKTNEVSVSLDYDKTILQPGWSNAKLLKWLKINLLGKTNEANFYCFMKCVEIDSVFVFKNVKDFWQAKPKYRYTLTSEAVKDNASGEIYWPVMQYMLYENYKAIGIKGCRRQQRGYFDYITSSYKVDSYEIDGNTDPSIDYNSFTEYHQIDIEDDPDANMSIRNSGRSNGFTTNFRGKTLNDFHRNITNLSKIWIDVIGVDDVYPGDIVDILYLEHAPPIGKIGYQHQGFWMVERVVHVISGEFITRLLLTRNGSDCGQACQLLQAAKRKRS